MERKMEGGKNEIGNLKLNITHDALRSAISSGRILELADTMARQAAAQVYGQIVEQLSAAALNMEGLQAGMNISFAFILGEVDEMYATRPPIHWPHGPLVSNPAGFVGSVNIGRPGGMNRVTAGASEM